MFITGFPDDVKERELNNMLRFLPGYEVGAAALCGGGWAAVGDHGRMPRRHLVTQRPPRPVPATPQRPSLQLAHSPRCCTVLQHRRCCPLGSRRRVPTAPPPRFALVQASQMHFRNGQAQGFALFSTGAAARQAVDAVQVRSGQVGGSCGGGCRTSSTLAGMQQRAPSPCGTMPACASQPPTHFHLLQNLVFDNDCVLRAEMAHKNM